MALHYYEGLIGTMTIKQKHGTFEIQIRQGNCLAVFIHVRKDEESDGVEGWTEDEWISIDDVEDSHIPYIWDYMD